MNLTLGGRDILIKTDLMKCFMSYKENKTECQLCSRIDDGIYSYCKSKTEEEYNHKRKLNQIQINCQYHKTAFDEYDEFDACNKNGNGYGRFAEGCRPTLECEQFCKLKGENK